MGCVSCAASPAIIGVMLQRPPERRPRRWFAAAVWISVVGHGVLLGALVWWAPVEPISVPPPMQIVIADPIPPPQRESGSPSKGEGAGGRANGTASQHALPPAPSPREEGSEKTAGQALAPFRDVRDLIDESNAKTGAERPELGLAARRARDQGFGHATDSIDGIPSLGTGERGDPRIPGSGGVDIAAVMSRDGRVAQAQTRAVQGQVHPFLFAAKERIEECWLPVASDVRALGAPIKVEDRSCRTQAHLRYHVARVHAVYDARGARLSFSVVGAPVSRDLKSRVERAVEEAGMPAIPPELLDREGVMRLAWNVYVDDFSMCGLIGRGANAHKPGGDEFIGIVELDGLY